jgi:hypothetical protein
MKLTRHAIERWQALSGETDADAARVELERIALAGVPYQDVDGFSHDIAPTASGSVTVVRYCDLVITVYE